MKSYLTLFIVVMILCPSLHCSHDTANAKLAKCGVGCISSNQCEHDSGDRDCRCIEFQCRKMEGRNAATSSCGGRCVSSQQCQDFCDCPDCWCIDFQCKSSRGRNPAFSSAEPFEKFMKSRPKMFPAPKHRMRKFSFVN